jgi:hypothetical protein
VQHDNATRPYLSFRLGSPVHPIYARSCRPGRWSTCGTRGVDGRVSHGGGSRAPDICRLNSVMHAPLGRTNVWTISPVPESLITLMLPRHSGQRRSCGAQVAQKSLWPHGDRNREGSSSQQTAQRSGGSSTIAIGSLSIVVACQCGLSPSTCSTPAQSALGAGCGEDATGFEVVCQSSSGSFRSCHSTGMGMSTLVARKPPDARPHSPKGESDTRNSEIYEL